MFFSLRNRLFIIFTCLLTIPLIILSMIIPSWFTSIIEDQTQELTIEAMDQYSLYIDLITTQAEDLGKQVLVNQTTQQWLKLEKKDANIPKEQSLLQKNQLKMMLSSMMVNNSNGMSISVVLNNGEGAWGNTPNLHNLDWFKDFTINEQRFVKSHIDPYMPAQGNSNSYILPLVDLNTVVSYGFIKVNFPSSLLETALRKITIGKNGHAYLLDQQGANVLEGKIDTPKRVLKNSLTKIKNNTKQKGLLETDYQGDKYFVFFQKLAVGDWILVSEVTKSDLFSKVNILQRNLLITSAIVFLITIFASFMLSSNIVSPLGKLAKAMKFIEHGDFLGAKRFMPTIKSSNDEVGYVIKVFDHTVDQLKHLIEIEYEANIRRKDAEYKALLLQINPHFLNNTLEIIGGLAVQGKNKEVMNVSIYLGRMMRYSLNTQNDVVRLGEEISYIRSYTDILKVRYEDALTIDIVEDPETRNLSIIKFILQPLVENAVKYSFIEKITAEIFIKTKKVNNQIMIVLEDKGIGMSEEVISDLVSEETKNERISVLASKGNSIGLKNVLGRLKLYYGERFSYQIESEKNVGTRITLCINFDRGDIHDEGHNHG
ncbi:histidine kinase [Bacillus sp. ISL-40]|uniref:sensor histidine kinase n=1 Tax=unclassified Bacillus (in: firmicutes) TaxID=185979 RepID=UPI001BEB224D|nr:MULTISPECIES: sensor histidine kinase [unclassified Bacillus (in: firmicutes)]MBT2697459.1 histidine kinase [Bacillus sp. ISL-40]MBT2720991.1 histidine kinase [Bacillus sp. ISL-46]MBT2741725.1 histidine kinase [Bacillus sp. ISL-77]